MRTFPKKYKHLNIVLRTFQSRIQIWKRAFWKVWKFEERSSQFFEIQKLEVSSNEWTLCHQNFKNDFSWILAIYWCIERSLMQTTTASYVSYWYTKWPGTGQQHFQTKALLIVWKEKLLLWVKTGFLAHYEPYGAFWKCCPTVIGHFVY